MADPRTFHETHDQRSGPPAPGRAEPLLWDALYAAAMVGLAPKLLWRAARGKYRSGWSDKMGYVPVRPAGPRIWIHAVSVGEAVAAGVLAAELERAMPEREVVVSTVTPTGQEVAQRRFGAERTFYLPLDFSGPARRALGRTRPEALVLMELELWPNLVAAAVRRGIPVVVVNGRISDRAFPRYRRFSRLFRRTASRLSAVGCQTEVYAERFRALGAPAERVVVTGTLKYDGVRTEPDPGAAELARRDLGLSPGERVLLGGSTHPGEEAALARAWRGIGGEGERWRLVVVPRHPERAGAVEAEFAREGLSTVRRTALARGEAETGPEDVILVDTVGELGTLYYAADLVFVGGSLVPHGGQNPIEPAGAGRPVVFGPHMFNFTETLELLVGAGGARQVGSEEDLARAVRELAADRAGRERLGSAGREAVRSRQGAARLSAELIGKALAARAP